MYCILTLPFDFMGRAIKVFVMAQFLMVKYKVNKEFQFACRTINQWINEKTASIGFVNSGYNKVAGWLHTYANRDPREAQNGQSQ